MLEKNLLIRASAGTGKTFSLATRVLRLMLFDRVPVSRIIALTFSRAAAQEIYTKILSRLWAAARDEDGARREKAMLLKNIDPLRLPEIEAQVGDWSCGRFRVLLREVLDAQYLGNIATLDSFILRIVKNFPLELGMQRAVEVMDDISAQEALDQAIRRVLARFDASEALPEIFLQAQGGELARRTKYKLDYMLGKEKWRDFLLAHPKSVDLDEDAIRAALQVPTGSALDGKIAKAVARLKLFAVFETEYLKSTRRAGRLTFGDFTAYASAGENTRRGIAKTNLEFRFDSILDHWALDEFQDTSLAQWRCLKNLVEETGSGDGTVMVVGDLKQSIYGWRGGNDEPFLELMAEPMFGGENEQLSSCNSFRYGTRIANFVNAVFAPENIGKIQTWTTADCSAAIDKWADSKCWMAHRACDENTGQARYGDYIKVQTVDDLMEGLYRETARIWADHQAARSTESVGILVRSNDTGKEVAEFLRQRGLPVVWEGMNALSDLPVVQAVLQLLKLADHPEDTFAWGVVNTLLPVGKILFPGLATAEEVSAAVGEKLARQGLARTLQEFCTVLSRPEIGLDALTQQKLRSLVRVAVDCEDKLGAGFSVDMFIARATGMRSREIAASSQVIRILTIHRSKGLTLDRVLVPMFESSRDSLDSLDNCAIIADDQGRWVVPHVSAEKAAGSKVLMAAIARKKNEKLSEQICTWYVALTRARKAMWVIVPRAEKSGTAFHFRDIILGAVGGEFESGEEPAYESRPPSSVPEVEAWERIVGEKKIRRRIPSAVHVAAGPAGRKLSVAALLEEDAGSAARQGIELHAKYAQIEWAKPEELSAMPESFRVAFVRPSAEAVCWREMPYELFEGGEWESGQIDRVVFWGAGENRQAVIYDFKSNAMLADERQEDFAARMQATYSGQLAAYRRAVAKLSGIPLARVSAHLLLEASGEIA